VGFTREKLNLSLIYVDMYHSYNWWYLHMFLTS